MLIKYDKEIDAKYIILQPARAKRGVAVRTEQVEPWLMVDYDKEGNIFGIEILNASENPVPEVLQELFSSSRFSTRLHPSFFQSLEKSMKSVVA